MRTVVVAALFVVALAWPGRAPAHAKTIGKARIVNGSVTVVRGDNSSAVKVGDAIEEHDLFETAADGSLGITFIDNTSFAIAPSSKIAIGTYFYDPRALKGNMLAQLKKGA